MQGTCKGSSFCKSINVLFNVWFRGLANIFEKATISLLSCPGLTAKVGRMCNVFEERTEKVVHCYIVTGWTFNALKGKSRNHIGCCIKAVL